MPQAQCMSQATDARKKAFAKNCKGWKKLYCGSCTFGSKGMNMVLDKCTTLEELFVKCLRGIIDAAVAELIGPDMVVASLKLCFKLSSHYRDPGTLDIRKNFVGFFNWKSFWYFSHFCYQSGYSFCSGRTICICGFW